MRAASEPNQPNTINSACADGTSGTYHSDESSDRTADCHDRWHQLRPGQNSHGQLDRLGLQHVTSDALDLYYAANASSPTWAFLKTIVPTAGGAQTLIDNLHAASGQPAGDSRQFRYQGTASSCSTGSYNDHDDLGLRCRDGTPDFSVSASPYSVSVNQGGTAPSTITVTSQSGSVPPPR